MLARAKLLKQQGVFDRRIITLARKDPGSRLLMTAPTVGPHIALAFKAGIDDPARFARSRTVGAHFGLTPRSYASGEVDYAGRNSKMGDRQVRHMLYVAAQIMLRRDQGLWCGLKVWALKAAKARGSAKARIALARQLAGVLHKMCVTGQPFRWRMNEAVP